MAPPTRSLVLALLGSIPLSLTHACAAREARPAPVPVATPAPIQDGAERGDGWVCTHVTQGVAVDPGEHGPCEWTREPDCRGMFVVYSQSSSGLVGSCATTLPPSIARP